jgi:hypothetical protein
MTHVNRVVTVNDGSGKSAVVLRDSPNHIEKPGLYWRSTPWAADELPVDNTIPGDRSVNVVARDPKGVFFRADEFPPNIKDTQERIQLMQETNKEVEQKYTPTEANTRDLRER